MNKREADEAAPIVVATLTTLLGLTPTRGRPGSDLRRAAGDVIAHVETLLRSDTIGEPLALCFDLAGELGVTLPQLEQVRVVPEATFPITVGGIEIKNALIEFSLATEGTVIANMTFTSREDVNAIRSSTNKAFAGIEEAVADSMDSITYRAIVSLHAAITSHLIETARPLPRMLNYRFGLTLSTLRITHRLYNDAGRADELRAENKIVHPAFCPLQGKALSA